MSTSINSERTGYSLASAGGGGADLSDLGYTAGDLTSGYTLTDPSTAINGVTIAGGVHTVTLNAVAASTNLTTSGATHTWPRWSIPLVANDSSGGTVRISGDDIFLVNVYLKSVAQSADLLVPVVGIAVDPTNNTATTMLGGGLQVRASSALVGAWVFNAGAFGTGAGQTNYYSSIFGAAGDVYMVSSLSTNGSGDYVGRAPRQANNSGVGTNDLFLLVGLSSQTGSSAFTAGTTCNFAFGYNVIKLQP